MVLSVDSITSCIPTFFIFPWSGIPDCNSSPHILYQENSYEFLNCYLLIQHINYHMTLRVIILNGNSSHFTRVQNLQWSHSPVILKFLQSVLNVSYDRTPI
jgi:hypothetical protein